MDLLAYAQIEDLSKLAEANGISVPRLRGYRLMSLEKPMTTEEMKEEETDAIRHVYREACGSDVPFDLHLRWYEASSRTDRIKRRFLTGEGDLRWELVHGKRRKNMKFLVKKMLRAVRTGQAMWNRYAGKPGVLYIHTRCGGGNWEWYGCKELEQKPWYLGRVDDWYDGSYCTIYARVESPTS